MRELSEGIWAPTGGLEPADLADARLELHWAAQAAAGVGRSLLPPEPDSSHHSFQWAPRSLALVQGLVPAEPPFRSAIRPRDLALMFLDSAGEILDEYPLHGRTLDDGFRWMEDRSSVLLGRALDGGLARPAAPLPRHPTGEGRRFAADRAMLMEISRYYHDADLVLGEVARTEEGAGPVRLWPHNFDIATLVTLGGTGENARTVGVGMVPGDSTYAQPYYYVTPWPSPDASELPPLSIGFWRAEGWAGAVLLASEFRGDDGRRVVESFLREAVDAARSVVRE